MGLAVSMTSNVTVVESPDAVVTCFIGCVGIAYITSSNYCLSSVMD